MVAVPAVTPVTSPDAALMVAPPVALHAPPPVPSLSVAVPVTHTFDAVMATGVGFTLTLMVVVAVLVPSDTCIGKCISTGITRICVYAKPVGVTLPPAVEVCVLPVATPPLLGAEITDHVNGRPAVWSLAVSNAFIGIVAF